MRGQCEVTKGIQVNGGRAKERNRRKRKSAVRRKGRVNASNAATQKEHEGWRQQLNRKTEQTIEREEKTRARLRGKPQTEELFDSTLRRVKARSKTFTADFLIPTSGFTGRRERRLLDESLCSESVNQSRSQTQENKGEKKSSSSEA